MSNELTLKLVKEFQGQLVLGGQGLLTDDGFHRSSVTSDSVFGVLRDNWVSNHHKVGVMFIPVGWTRLRDPSS